MSGLKGTNVSDEYEALREALRAGPQAWLTTGTKDGKATLKMGECATNPNYIKAHSAWVWQSLYAVDPTTIRRLLSERDALAEQVAADGRRLMKATAEYDGFGSVPMDKYDYAMQAAAERGHDEPTEDDELEGVRRLLDAAIASTPAAGE